MATLEHRIEHWLASSSLRSQIKLALLLAVSSLAIAFAIGLIGAWANGLGILLFMLAIPVLGALIVVGAFVLVTKAFRQFADFETWRQRVVAFLLGPAMAAASTLAFLPVLWAGGWLGDLSQLAVSYADYEAIIAQSRAAQKEEWFAESRGITYSVDVGPPVRVAFNPAGFLDNWSGIVFDPTGDVMLADGFDEQGKFVAPDRITKIFGGDLVSCRHLWGDYYSCSFT